MKVRNRMTIELSNSALVVIMVINTFLRLTWLWCFLWGHWLQLGVCMCVCVCMCMCVWAQSCLTLYDPMDCSPPGSSVHGIFQTRILERVATAKLRCQGSSVSKWPDSDSLAWDVPMVTVWHPAWLALHVLRWYQCLTKHRLLILTVTPWKLHQHQRRVKWRVKHVDFDPWGPGFEPWVCISICMTSGGIGMLYAIESSTM